MIRIAICDNNINELSHKIYQLNKYKSSKFFKIKNTPFQSGFELISALTNGSNFDIYLIEIELPFFSGIDIAKEIRKFDKSAHIIFFAPTQEYAFESYSVKATNYLLKPVTEEHLYLELDELLEKIKIEKQNFMIVKSLNGLQKIIISNIIYAEVVRRNVFYHLISGKTIECIEPFVKVCSVLLLYPEYLKPHRSYIINMNYVDSINSSSIIMQTHSTIPIAQSKSKEIKLIYTTYNKED